MSVLIVVAHPDDEVLGCGATAAWLAASGVSVRCCILSGNAEARRHRPEVQALHDDLRRAGEILGLGEPIIGDFPNIQFNTVPHLSMVQFIEAAMVETRAETLFTHHPRDLNDDHLHTSRACQAAARLGQRRPDMPALRALHFMETPSATDWSFRNGYPAFEPDTFVEVGEAFLEKKIEALAAYRGVMRDYPHPRSREALTGLAACRGAQAGMRYAEGFQTGLRALRSGDFAP